MIKGFFVLLCVLVLFSLKSFSQQPVVFKGDNIIIGKYVSILEDPGNRLTISDVRASSRFTPSLIQTPNLQLSKSGFWLKFAVKNESASDDLILALEYPTLTVCEFYYPQKGSYTVQKLSDDAPFRKRKYQHQNFLFDIHLPADSTGMYYLHVESTEEMVLPLILATPQKMAESLLAGNILWGIFMGLILVMVLYNFFIFLFTRDNSYLYYVLYSTFIGLTQTTLSGYTYHYLFANSPGLFHNCIIIFPALAGISAMLFVRSFLHTKSSTPKLHKFFLIAILAYCTAIALRLMGLGQASYRMIDFSALFTTALIYTVAVKISMQGYRPAKLFLLAWTIFFAGIILFTLRNLGVLPYNNFTNYTMESGIAFEVTLLSLALADKINILKKEKEASQAESLEIAKENERIIREQNVILETKVVERTAELNTTLEDLKETQAQLVESEKMASLGQLTAGIAHEINNPINFVTSNVSPLKRDVEMLFDAIGAIEGIGLSGVPVAEKQQQIDEYKEELDFDYLKTEIKHLLNGIYDGASRTAEIVKGLRVFSRLDEDDLKIADINEGVESTMIILNNQLGAIRVDRKYGNLPPVECYPGKLNQVFLNLMSNAIYAVHKKFGEESGGRISITTSSDEKNVFIKIEDNGTGMDTQVQKKIFEPFFTTKEVGEGTGLGLSIAYNTIKKHQGEINMVSAPGEGATFTIKLPLSYATIPV
jgi:two-component system NtrC family sensor kinase